MSVLDVMTRAPSCCTAETPLPVVARMMVDCNCGCIPVIDDAERPTGMITDRDIVCRSVALDMNPLEMMAGAVMTPDCVTVTTETSVEDCAALLQQKQIRRAVVVDRDGRVVGIVAQADLARCSETLGGELVAAVSEPSIRPSAVH
ncbi:MAG: CBS domain-containing protein [Myxococcota bacterium]|nr:CBS domain-containing protein [Myxococcota bacterium]